MESVKKLVDHENMEINFSFLPLFLSSRPPPLLPTPHLLHFVKFVKLELLLTHLINIYNALIHRLEEKFPLPMLTWPRDSHSICQTAEEQL